MDKDYERIAYLLAAQYAGNELSKNSSQFETKEDKAETLFEHFKFAFDYYYEKFFLLDK